MDAATRKSIVMRTVHVIGVIFLFVILVKCSECADETKPAAQSRDEKLATERFELMKKRLMAAKVTSKESWTTQLSGRVRRYNQGWIRRRPVMSFRSKSPASPKMEVKRMNNERHSRFARVA